MMKKYKYLPLLCLATTSFALAGDLTIPNTFVADTPAKASEVNDNFSAAQTAVNDNNVRISENKSEILLNDTDINTVQTDILDLFNKSWSTSGNNLYYDSGNVGIGTTSPNSKLHIVDSVASQLELDGGPSADSGIRFHNKLGDTANFRYDGDTSAFEFRMGLDPSDTKVVISTSGNVGIGTISPEHILHIKNDDKPVIQFIGSGDDAVGRLKLSYYPIESFSRLSSWGTGGYKEMQIAASDLIINKDIGAGNVGIGTASPLSKLAVTGLPTSPPDPSGNAGVVCVTNDGNFWLDNDGTADCS